MQYPTIPPQPDGSGAGPGWPANELERVLVAAIGDPGATPRVVEVLRRSQVWVPLPGGPGQEPGTLALPTTELAGQPFVPVFSSEEQFLRIAGNISFTVAPVFELAQGMPLGVGLVVNPEGTVGIPIPAAGVAELCAGGPELPTPGARVELRLPGPHEDPVEFLSAAVGELSNTPVVLTARHAIAQVEQDEQKLFVGVQFDQLWADLRDPAVQDAAVQAVVQALGRALGVAPLRCDLDVVLLDSTQDPVAEWLLTFVAPFFERGRSGH